MLNPANTLRNLDVQIGRRTLYGLVESTRSGSGGYVRIFTIVPPYADNAEPLLCEVTFHAIEACQFKTKEHNGNTWIFVPGCGLDRLTFVADTIAMLLGRKSTIPTRRI